MPCFDQNTCRSVTCKREHSKGFKVATHPEATLTSPDVGRVETHDEVREDCLGYHCVVAANIIPMQPMSEMQSCSSCRKSSCEVAFSRNQKYCKYCASEKNCAWRRSRPGYMATWARERYASNPEYRQLRLYRQRMRHALNGKAKASSARKLLGCSPSELVIHLSKHVEAGKHLEDYHVDHIIPCALYDMNNADDVQRCFNYINLQLLTRADNQTKGAKLPALTANMLHLLPEAYQKNCGASFVQKRVPIK